ncbi:MAG: SDR family oxidoreductase [Candidatus Izimaplasma sp.]|nr:SDR family oxidoreductase [Candidatus Izimaplasma bacterium]
MSKRTVFITGASGGIGRAIAKRFIVDGYKTILHYNTHKNRVKELKDEMESEGYEDMYVFGANLTNPKELDTLVKRLEKDDIVIDVLINNAGIKMDAKIDDMTDDQFKSVIETNVTGTFMLTKRFIPMMKQQNYGRIINISSGLAQHGSVGKINYGASKAAVENMTKNLAYELGPYGITVNTVAPGLIETEMTKDVTDKEKEAYIQKIPIRRLVEGKDVAQVCAFFADERSGSISNQVVGVNGGLR